MYLSTVDYLSDGTTRVFGVPFPYINESYIKVYKKAPWEAGGITEPIPFTWQTPNTLYISETVPSGWTVRVRRETELNKNLVRFTDQAYLVIGKHLDLQALQHLHLIQELHDRKLDVDEFNSVIADMEDRLASKEELEAAVNELDQKKADKDAVDKAIAELDQKKADKTAVDAAINALDRKKADKTELSALDQRKADKTQVNELDQKKADRTELNNAINSLDQKKADKTQVNEIDALLKKHAPRHAKNGADPVSPKDIGAMPEAPADGKTYLGSGGAWTPFNTEDVLPPGGESNEFLGYTADGVRGWININDFPKPYGDNHGVVKPDNKTIRAYNGTLSVVGYAGGGIGPSERNVSEVQYVVADGVKTEFEITHTLQSGSLLIGMESLKRQKARSF